ncbi:unnamed protein product [Alternaria alternata]
MPPKTPRDSSNEKNNKEELPQSQGTRVLRDRNPKPATSQGLPSSSSNQFSATNKGTGSGGDIGVFKRPREIVDRDLETRRQKLIKTLQNAENAAEIPDFETHLRDQARAKELNEDDQEEFIAVANKAVGGSNKFKADYREEFDETMRITAKPMRKGLPPALLTEDAKYDKKLRPFIDLFEQDNVGATEEIDYEKMAELIWRVGLHIAARETSFDWKTSYDKQDAVAPGRTQIMPAKPTLELQGDELNKFSKPPMTPIEYNASVGHHHVETTSWAEATDGRRERAKEETMNRMPESDVESSDEDSSDDEGDDPEPTRWLEPPTARHDYKSGIYNRHQLRQGLKYLGLSQNAPELKELHDRIDKWDRETRARRGAQYPSVKNLKVFDDDWMAQVKAKLDEQDPQDGESEEGSDEEFEGGQEENSEEGQGQGFDQEQDSDPEDVDEDDMNVDQASEQGDSGKNLMSGVVEGVFTISTEQQTTNRTTIASSHTSKTPRATKSGEKATGAAGTEPPRRSERNIKK